MARTAGLPHGAIAAVCVLGGLAAGPTAAASPEALADPPVIRLAQATDGYSLGRPSLLTTATGSTLVAWHQYAAAPNSIHVARRAGGRFKSVVVPQSGLVEIGPAYLSEDVVGDRLLLTANAHSATLDDLGLYVWTSTTDGRTWSAPVRVWDSFSSGQIAPDGTGGFWAITDQTGASVTHVDRSLTPRHWPDDDVLLTDRLGSRAAIDVAATGPRHLLLFGWGGADSAGWVHLGSTPGRAGDRRLIRGLQGDGGVALAADRKGAVLGGIRRVARSGVETRKLFAAGIVARSSGTATYKPRLVSGQDDVVSYAVSEVPTKAGRASGLFVMTWLDADGRLRTAHSTRKGDPRWSDPTTVLTFPARGYTFPGALGVTGGWVALQANNTDLAPVEIAVPLG